MPKIFQNQINRNITVVDHLKDLISKEIETRQDLFTQSGVSTGEIEIWITKKSTWQMIGVFHQILLTHVCDLGLGQMSHFSCDEGIKNNRQ